MGRPFTTYPLAYDFYYMWVTGKVAREGGDPYHSIHLHPQFEAVGWPPAEGIYNFLHPPWVMWLYSLLSYIPFEVAKCVWLATICVGTLFAARFCVRILGVDGSAKEGALMFATLLFPPFLSNLFWGQANFEILLGLVLYLWYANMERHCLAGTCLTLSFVKPHLLVPLYCALGVHAIKTRNWRFMGGVILGIGTQALLSLLICPSVYTHYPIEHSLTETVTLPGMGISQVLYFISGVIVPPSFWIVAGAVLGACVGYMREPARVRDAFILVSMSFLLAPYGWSHYLLVLLPIYLAAVSLLVTMMPHGFRIAIALVSCVVTPIMMTARFEPVFFVMSGVAVWASFRLPLPDSLHPGGPEMKLARA